MYVYIILPTEYIYKMHLSSWSSVPISKSSPNRFPGKKFDTNRQKNVNFLEKNTS